jgi:hypothetical protein
VDDGIDQHRRRTASVVAAVVGLVVVLVASIVAVTQVQDRSPSAGAGLVLTTTMVDAPSTTTTAPRPSSTTTVPPTPVTIGPSGSFVVAPAGTFQTGTGPLRTYQVEVEASTGVDPAAFAAEVDAALGDARSWTGDGSVSLQRVPEGGEFRIVLATPATTDELCLPLQTVGRFSCEQGGDAIINLDRWNGAVEHWTVGLPAYRQMVVNHEVGHVLGHGHRSCPAAGAPAPVMQQQTKSLDGCLENPWPFP